MTRSRLTQEICLGLVLVAVMAALPFLAGNRYVIGQLIVFCLWATVAVQWNLVLGYAGIFSLAQLALYACGAYATAMLGFFLHWPLWLAMPAAAVITAFLGLVIGAASLRLRGPYVALLTLAIAQVIYVLIITEANCFTYIDGVCQQLFGGTRGLSHFGDLGFRALLGYKFIYGNYYLALALLVVSTIVTLVVIRGPLGLAFRALRDNPGYAISRGINRFKYQLLAFAVSAFFTGLAGAMQAAHFNSAGPSLFAPSLLLFLLAAIVIGGIGRFWGPIVGVVLLMLIDEGLKEVADYRNIGLGLLIAAFVILLPQGLTGWFGQLAERLTHPQKAGP
ncbi:MAG TPA: branched-chain amino acid ABC transporter permease [Dongiaceae bacterium]